MSDKADIHWEAAQRRRRILPFRGLIQDAAFIHHAASVRYDGMLNSRHVRQVIEDNLALSRRYRFPKSPEGSE